MRINSLNANLNTNANPNFGMKLKLVKGSNINYALENGLFRMGEEKDLKKAGEILASLEPHDVEVHLGDPINDTFTLLAFHKDNFLDLVWIKDTQKFIQKLPAAAKKLSELVMTKYQDDIKKFAE